MPIKKEFPEDGRVMVATFIDPVTFKELSDAIQEGQAHRDSKTHIVHVICDFYDCPRPPLGLLRARYAPLFTHARRGEIVFVGANHLVHSLVVLAASFTGNSHKIKFLDSLDEARTFLQKTILKDKQVEAAVK